MLPARRPLSREPCEGWQRCTRFAVVRRQEWRGGGGGRVSEALVLVHKVCQTRGEGSRKGACAGGGEAGRPGRVRLDTHRTLWCALVAFFLCVCACPPLLSFTETRGAPGLPATPTLPTRCHTNVHREKDREKGRCRRGLPPLFRCLSFLCSFCAEGGGRCVVLWMQKKTERRASYARRACVWATQEQSKTESPQKKIGTAIFFLARHPKDFQISPFPPPPLSPSIVPVPLHPPGVSDWSDIACPPPPPARVCLKA